MCRAQQDYAFAYAHQREASKRKTHKEIERHKNNQVGEKDPSGPRRKLVGDVDVAAIAVAKSASDDGVERGAECVQHVDGADVAVRKEVLVVLRL